jgi:hypothetical protein
MASLGAVLRSTIRNLEAIRDKQNPPSKVVLEQIDTLDKQLIALIDASIQNTTPKYIAAANSMTEAADKSQQAINDLAKVADTIAKVAVAIQKVSELLTSVV